MTAENGNGELRQLLEIKRAYRQVPAVGPFDFQELLELTIPILCCHADSPPLRS